MNKKRAIGIAILIYLGSMVIGMIVCGILGIEPDMTKPIPPFMWITSAISAVVLSTGGAYWYFRGKNLPANRTHGLRFGATIVVIGFLLDLLFFASLSFSGFNPVEVMSHYYSQPPFWITLILILLGSGFVGHYLEQKKA